MDQRDHDRRDEDEFHSEHHNSSSEFEAGRPPLRPDSCDFLLDAIDAQLGMLQVKDQQRGHIDIEPFRLSQSLSKDTGLGSTASHTNDTPVSCLDLQVTPAVERTADRTTLATWELDVWTSSKVQMESHKEQVMWRLDRLLGDTCKQAPMSSDPSESICTEDFVRRFSEEMLELSLPEERVQELDKEEEAERTLVTSDGDPCLSHRNSQHGVGSEATTNVKSSKHTTSVAFFQCKPEQIEELERCCETSVVPTSHAVFCSTEVEKEHQNPKHISSPSARCLAGVPVWNFDTVSIDSDLDSVCTDQVRQHLHRWAVERPTGAVKKSIQLKAQERCRADSIDDATGTDEEPNGHRSRRSKLEKASEKMHSAWVETSQRLSSLRQRCAKEEETLRMKRSHLTEVKLSLYELQLRRKHAFQDLERLSVETGHLEAENRQSEVLLKERQAQIDSLSCQMQKLERQKESYVCEVRILQEELKMKEQLKQLSCIGETNTVKSELERQAMEIQLGHAKAELLSEKRRAREKQESMQQTLEQTCEELRRASEAETSLRKRCSHLEGTKKQIERQVQELRSKLEACTVKLDTLEKMLGQKEQQLRDVQEQHGGLQTENDSLKRELEFMKSQQQRALNEAREHAHAMMAALKQQRNDLVSVHEQQIQKLKEDEAKALKNSLEHQKEESRKREEELHAETLQKVHTAVDEERRKCEADKIAAVHFHCGLLEEQNSRSLETARSDMQREKNNTLTLQHQVAELQSRVQELEAERYVQQREQDSLLSVVCRSLKQEQQEQLEKLQEHMMQESEKTVLQLEQAKGETKKIRMMLEEQQISHNEARAEQEQQLGLWAQKLLAECDFLHFLIEKNGGQQNSVQLPPSSTIDEALTQLKAQRDPLKHLIEYLHQELDSQRQASEQLLKDKKRELRIQREQMRTERNQALDSLKERLIQEHIEELNSLKWCHVNAEGLEASLHKQLAAKDMELRQVQRNMTQWKEQTTARLACKFEEELTAELERKTSTSEEEKVRMEGQRKLSAKYHEAHHSDCLSHIYAADPQSSSDVKSLQLVHNLQSRVNQLRAENQTWMPTGPNLHTLNHQESRKARVLR
ncbi:uncharacterized protein LOC144018559 isoform X2 [Festucalex cinctus]